MTREKTSKLTDTSFGSRIKLEINLTKCEFKARDNVFSVYNDRV